MNTSASQFSRRKLRSFSLSLVPVKNIYGKAVSPSPDLDSIPQFSGLGIGPRWEVAESELARNRLQFDSDS